MWPKKLFKYLEPGHVIKLFQYPDLFTIWRLNISQLDIYLPVDYWASLVYGFPTV